MTETTRDVPFQPGTEVTATITGRVIHSDRHGSVVIEYVKGNGFADRIVVRDCGPAVTVTPTAAPDRAELARRQHAARMVADSCLDPEQIRSSHAEFAARWNDLCPAGSPVLVRSGDGDLRPATVAGPAWTGDDGWASVAVDGWGRQPLSAVLPSPDFDGAAVAS